MVHCKLLKYQIFRPIFRKTSKKMVRHTRQMKFCICRSSHNFQTPFCRLSICFPQESILHCATIPGFPFFRIPEDTVCRGVVVNLSNMATYEKPHHLFPWPKPPNNAEVPEINSTYSLLQINPRTRCNLINGS